MLKKKLVALGVSTLAVTAVVGAGFAGWTFTSTVEGEHDLGVHITAAFSFGTVSVDSDQPDTVVLDQSGVTLAKTGALTTALPSVTAKWTVNANSYNDAFTEGLTYQVNVYIINALANYVNCGTIDSETITVDDPVGYTKYVLTPTTSSATESGTDVVVEMTIDNPFEYITAEKPTTLDEYKTMVAAITGGSSTSIAEDTPYDVAASSDTPVIIEFTVAKTTTTTD